MRRFALGLARAGLAWDFATSREAGGLLGSGHRGFYSMLGLKGMKRLYPIGLLIA
jgi:hypothetical protein